MRFPLPEEAEARFDIVLYEDSQFGAFRDRDVSSNPQEKSPEYESNRIFHHYPERLAIELLIKTAMDDSTGISFSDHFTAHWVISLRTSESRLRRY
jgi:hypothetical protein